jgi:hypothetical protein
MKTARSIMSAGYFFRFYFPFILGSFMVAPGLAELGLLDAP